MVVRAVDLQQVLAKLPEVGRDSATQQQQPAAAQQLLANEEGKRRQERAETVKQFDETGLAAVHERQGRQGEEGLADEEHEEQSPADEAADEQVTAAARAAQARLGRHVDIQA